MSVVERSGRNPHCSSGNNPFASQPGHYSRLHGLQNFRSEFKGLSAAEDGGMTAIIARIKSSFTETPPAVIQSGDTRKKHGTGERSQALLSSSTLERTGKSPHALFPTNTLRFSRKPLSACDLSSVATVTKNEKEDTTGRRAAYSKYWEEANTERGRFGSSVDDHALGTSSQQAAIAGPAAVADDLRVEAAMAAGLRGHGKDGVHWGKHHHHHAPGSGEGQEATNAKLRQVYLRQKRPPKSRSVVFADCATMQAAASARRGTGAGVGTGAYMRSYRGVGDEGWTRRRARGSKRRAEQENFFLARRSTGNNIKVTVTASGSAADVGGGGALGVGIGGVTPRPRRSSFSGQGWESHTIKAQRKTEEYMLGREDLAPDMRPDVVLENEVSLAYDVDLGDAGMLGVGAYGTVRAAVHRSTGRQVAIKTMIKKYLFSDAEKASVEREIEIQKRLVNNHVIRLYEIYQSTEKLYLVVERAPCGSLEQFLYLRYRMTELDAKRVVRQLLEGLSYLHKSGIVHCDLKPANILFSDIDQGVNTTTDLSSTGGGKGSDKSLPRAQAITPPASLSGLVVKICDFGHSRKVPDCRYYKFTGDINKIPFHMFKHTGTDGFVAPEVLKSEPYGKAADTWSTGCMLYQMLTGRMPWMPSRACLHRPLSTSGPSWKKISAQAKSLVEDLLTADQNIRADVEQATQHPWFEDFHHCARMPTSAPGGRLSSSKRGPKGSCPMGLLASPRDEGVRNGDVAAGWRGSGGSRGLKTKIEVNAGGGCKEPDGTDTAHIKNRASTDSVISTPMCSGTPDIRIG